MYRIVFVIGILFLTSCHTKQDKWKLVWSDEFEKGGLPDSTYWNYDTGGDGWGNNELQYYKKADTNNVIVRDGKLVITARKEQFDSNSYTSTRLVTKNKVDWLYGKIAVKAKLPEGRGMWPAIWMLPTDWAYGEWPDSGEIDIMENVGFMPDSVFNSIHTKSFNHVIHTQKTIGMYLPDVYTNFHVYASEWNKDSILFFVDGKKTFAFANTKRGPDEWPFDKKFHLILNIAVGGNWGGTKGVDSTISHSSMEVEYVRLYQQQKDSK